MISTREVKVVIVATVQIPCEVSLPLAANTLTERLPNMLREVGYVPRVTIDLWETES